MMGWYYLFIMDMIYDQAWCRILLDGWMDLVRDGLWCTMDAVNDG